MSLRSAIPALRRGLRDVIHDANTLNALRVQTEAHRLVPVDTSSLQRTIRVEGPEGSGLQVRHTVIAGDPTATRPNDGQPVIYAPDVEFGTAQSRAQPFMTPAARDLEPKPAYRDALQALIHRVRL